MKELIVDLFSKKRLKIFIFNLTNHVGRKSVINRDNFIKKTLINQNKNLRILDAGAGECKYRKYCKHLNYLSQDVCEYDGKGDGDALQTGKWEFSEIDIVSDITNIPEPDCSFDIILCTEVFQHIINPKAAIQEFSRLLKTDGTLILTTPVSSFTHFSPYYYNNGFSKYYLEILLPENRFKIEELNYNGNYFEYMATEIQRIPYMAQRYSKFGFISKFIYAPISIILLILLNKFSSNDTHSNEFASGGIHTIAKKTSS